jgi:hypothetical protein
MSVSRAANAGRGQTLADRQGSLPWRFAQQQSDLPRRVLQSGKLRQRSRRHDRRRQRRERIPVLLRRPHQRPAVKADPPDHVRER